MAEQQPAEPPSSEAHVVASAASTEAEQPEVAVDSSDPQPGPEADEMVQDQQAPDRPDAEGDVAMDDAPDTEPAPPVSNTLPQEVEAEGDEAHPAAEAEAHNEGRAASSAPAEEATPIAPDDAGGAASAPPAEGDAVPVVGDAASAAAPAGETGSTVPAAGEEASTAPAAGEEEASPVPAAGEAASAASASREAASEAPAAGEPASASQATAPAAGASSGATQATAPVAKSPAPSKVESKKDKKKEEKKKEKKERKEKKKEEKQEKRTAKELAKLAKKFREGDIIMIWGLPGDMGKLNGQKGTMLNFVKEKAQFAVKLHSDESQVVNVKAENMVVVEAAAKKRKPKPLPPVITGPPAKAQPTDSSKRLKQEADVSELQEAKPKAADRGDAMKDFWGEDDDPADVAVPWEGGSEPASMQTQPSHQPRA